MVVRGRLQVMMLCGCMLGWVVFMSSKHVCVLVLKPVSCLLVVMLCVMLLTAIGTLSLQANLATSNTCRFNHSSSSSSSSSQPPLLAAMVAAMAAQAPPFKSTPPTQP